MVIYVSRPIDLNGNAAPDYERMLLEHVSALERGLLSKGFEVRRPGGVPRNPRADDGARCIALSESKSEQRYLPLPITPGGTPNIETVATIGHPAKGGLVSAYIDSFIGVGVSDVPFAGSVVEGYDMLLRRTILDVVEPLFSNIQVYERH